MDFEHITESFTDFICPLGKAGEWYIASDIGFNVVYAFSKESKPRSFETYLPYPVIYLNDVGFVEVAFGALCGNNILIVKMDEESGNIEFDIAPNLSSNLIVIYSESSPRETYYLYNNREIAQVSPKSGRVVVYSRFNPKASPRMSTREDILAFNSLRKEVRFPSFSSTFIPLHCIKSGKLYYLIVERFTSRVDPSEKMVILIFDEYRYLGQAIHDFNETTPHGLYSYNLAIYGRYLYVYLSNLYVVDLMTIRAPNQLTHIDDPAFPEKVNDLRSNPTAITSIDLSRCAKNETVGELVIFTNERILIGGSQGLFSADYFKFTPRMFLEAPRNVREEMEALLVVIQKISPEFPRELKVYIIEMLF